MIRLIPLPLAGTGGGTNFNKAVAESIGIADSQTKVANFPRSVAESIAIADSQTAITAFLKSVAESISIADSQTSVANFPKSVAESIAIADSQTAITAFLANIAESVSIADTPSETAAFLASVAEGFGIADTVSAGGDFGETVAETIAISDAFTAVFDGGQTSRGGIYWKPEKDYQWPDLKSEIRQAVEDIARRSNELPEAEQIVPEVVEAVRATVPMLPSFNLQQLIFEITSAILDVQMAEDEEAAAMLLLCE